MGKNSKILKSLSERIRSIGRNPSPVLSQVPIAVKSLVDSRFDRSLSPEGIAFAPLKDKSGRKPIIGFKNSISYRQEGNRVVAVTGKGYLKYHQEGTKNLVRRNPFPVSQVPKEWTLAVYKAVLDGMKRRLSGTRA